MLALNERPLLNMGAAGEAIVESERVRVERKEINAHIG